MLLEETVADVQTADCRMNGLVYLYKYFLSTRSGIVNLYSP